LVDTTTERLAERIGLVWAELVSLGSFAEQDDEIRQRDRSFIEPLEPDVRRALVDLLQAAGPWIRRFPTARILDEEHASFHTPTDRLGPAREVASAAEDNEVIRSEDADVLEAAISAGQRTGHQSAKARSFSIFSVRNLTYRVVGIALTGIATGVFVQIGKEVAVQSDLVQKSVRLIISAEQPIKNFVADLPADIRAGIKALIEKIKLEAGGP
jgi:hypothetical protein